MAKEINTKQEEVSMEKEIKEVLEMKETVLEMAGEVCFRLGQASTKVNVIFEKEIMQNAMSALSDEKNADSRKDRENCIKILTAYYLALGMGEDFGSF